MYLVGLCGALRTGSYNRLLLAEAARLFAPTRFSEGDLRLPLYDGDDEAQSGVPAAAQLLADQISRADAIIIATPEYNGAPSGVLKNALDWVSRVEGKPFKDKPMALLSASAGPSGGENAQAKLRAWLPGFHPVLLDAPQIHIGRSADAFDPEGRLIDPDQTATLTALMQALRAAV
ncbi:MAG: NAD(P)H-dependent oxidoreductase [Rhodobacteraceae bacterium]|nr:NAD(P)H-dependent oxidoreductase [Paracoccaceae bacterium]